MQTILKRIRTAVVCSAATVLMTGMTVFAASGYVDGYMNGNTGVSICVNTSGYSTYCESYVTEGLSQASSTVVAYASGVVASGDGVTASGTVSAVSAWANGAVYNGGYPASGVGWSGSKQIK